MKRIAVIMALLSIFLWCSNSVLAYPLMDGHYTVSTEVTGLAEGFYTYDYAVYNVDQGTPFTFQGLNAFIIQVPLTASLRNIMNPLNDPTFSGGDWRHWANTTALNGGGFSGEIPESGYQWIGWYGQGTIYPRGTTAHFIFEMNAPPESNLGYAVTYSPSYAVFQSNVGSPVPVPPTVLLLGSGLLGLVGWRRFRKG